MSRGNVQRPSSEKQRGKREDQLPFCSPNEREVEQSRASCEEEGTSHYCSSNLRSIDFFVSVCEVGWDRGVEPILQVIGGEWTKVFQLSQWSHVYRFTICKRVRERVEITFLITQTHKNKVRKSK